MCGIVGIAGYSPVSSSLYEALSILQHRGQDAAGMASCDQGKMFFHKANGLVRDVFLPADLKRLDRRHGYRPRPLSHGRQPFAP